MADPSPEEVEAAAKAVQGTMFDNGLPNAREDAEALARAALAAAYKQGELIRLSEEEREALEQLLEGMSSEPLRTIYERLSTKEGTE